VAEPAPQAIYDLRLAEIADAAKLGREVVPTAVLMAGPGPGHPGLVPHTENVAESSHQ